MGSETAISWTDATFNPWWGCTKVGPGCDGCYAAAFDHRLGGAHWGPGAPRRYFGDKHWNEPLRWAKKLPAKLGRRPRVFCASMADVFDNEVEQVHRDRLWALIRATPEMDWLLVTKRVGNIQKMLPPDWGPVGYPNVWLILTVVNQEEADRDIPKLRRIPAVVRGLSVEPLIDHMILLSRGLLDGIHWVICGGESAQPRHKPRHMAERWATSLREQCGMARVAFHMKQMSELDHPDTFKDFASFPQDLQVREFPHA
jgi:protein gp37